MTGGKRGTGLGNGSEWVWGRLTRRSVSEGGVSERGREGRKGKRRKRGGWVGVHVMVLSGCGALLNAEVAGAVMGSQVLRGEGADGSK